MSNSLKTNKNQKFQWCEICTISIKKKYLSVCAFVCTGISFFPKKDLKVFPLPPALDAPRVLTVSDFYEKNADHLVTFSEVSKPSQMSDFDKTHLFVYSEDCLSLQKKEDISELVGWCFFDKTSNETGDIISVQKMPTQVLLVAKVSGEDFSFPLIDEFIIEKNDKNKSLTLKLPMNYFV